jgi:hypothetical protein
MKPGAAQMQDDTLMSELNSPVAIASALLGGSLCLMSKTMGDEAVLQLLQNAARGVRAGDLRDGGRC